MSIAEFSGDVIEQPSVDDGDAEAAREGHVPQGLPRAHLGGHFQLALLVESKVLFVKFLSPEIQKDDCPPGLQQSCQLRPGG